MKRWPPSKTFAWKRSVCWAAHPSNWLSADRRSTPGWRRFCRQFLPNCSPQVQKKHFRSFSQCCSPRETHLPFRRIISSRFVWRCLSSDVTAWARRCLACQRGKIHRHTRLVPLPIPIPQRHFSHLHVDLVGPLQYSDNFNYIFTFIHHTSKWMEAIPLSETSAAARAKVLTFTWISRFEVPETITSDCGPQFISNLWLQLCEMLNMSHKQTTVTTLSQTVQASRTRRRGNMGGITL